MIVLPTMHKRIRRSFLRLVLLFGALGVLMVTGITIAGRVPSELIRMNYDSIAYAQEMVRAMNGIRFPELYRDTDTLGWEKRFADTLEQASGNITEEAERKVITDLQASWDAYRQTPDDANYRGLHARIETGLPRRGGCSFQGQRDPLRSQRFIDSSHKRENPPEA